MNNIKEAKKILIIDLLYLGDLIFTTPFLRSLRKAYPKARIDLVANSIFAPIMEDNPHLDNIYAYNKKWSIKESLNFAKSLREENYQLGLNIHGNWRTALLLRSIKPEYSIGYGGKGRGIFLQEELAPSKEKHMVEVYLDFLKDLGLAVDKDRSLELGVDSKAKESMEDFLKEECVSEGDRIVGINTGGSWPTKRWTKKGFAQLADALMTRGDKVIFFGGPTDVKCVEEIVGMMEKTPIIAAGRTSLKELAALASLCELFISGDSGPIHVAAAVGTKTVAIFGPSDEKKYRPYGEGHIVLENGIECRPCGEHQCPLEHHNCMEKVGYQKVIDKL
ncbi:lipopolysaccharide heptosyltransferase II [Halonatronum saccharophilum]|uniref:lipopolysaccharide heptosyltransferase II n=1 Tax=Halonatronum saccharophilum TaxID=150060 RepID=UPI0004B03193|nr:lipopolysaccharide heptosyltransferase II [Halonatronum saccharophilum]